MLKGVAGGAVAREWAPDSYGEPAGPYRPAVDLPGGSRDEAGKRDRRGARAARSWRSPTGRSDSRAAPRSPREAGRDRPRSRTTTQLRSVVHRVRPPTEVGAARETRRHSAFGAHPRVPLRELRLAERRRWAWRRPVAVRGIAALGGVASALGRVAAALGRVAAALGRVAAALGRVAPALGRVAPALGGVAPANCADGDPARCASVSAAT